MLTSLKRLGLFLWLEVEAVVRWLGRLGKLDIDDFYLIIF